MCFGGGNSSTPTLAPITIPTPTGSTSQGTGALPTSSQLGASGPLGYQDFGNVPTVTAATVDPNSALSSGLTQFENANEQALQPTFQAQDLALQDNLASRGIVDSGASTYLNQNLAQGQASTLASANAPIIEGAQSAFNTDELANMQAQNNASALNAGYYNQAVTGNEDAYNNYENELEQQGTQYGEGLLEGYLGSYGGANTTTLGSIAGAPGAISGASYQAGQEVPNYGGAFSSAFNSLTGSSSPGGGNYNPMQDQAAGGGNALTPGAGAGGEDVSAGWGDFG